jgi:hypothetical protein
VLITLSVPADNERGPQFMEQALAAIHQANIARRQLTLGVGCRNKTVALFVQLPPELNAVVGNQIEAYYPDCAMKVLGDDAFAAPAGTLAWSVEIRLKPELFPIRRYAQFEDLLNRNTSDPLTGLFAALAPGKQQAFQSRIEIIVWPASHRRVKRARKTVRRLASPFFRSHLTLARLYALATTMPPPHPSPEMFNDTDIATMP